MSWCDGDQCHMCPGLMEPAPALGCSCHVDPPCHGCTERAVQCRVCGWQPVDGDLPSDEARAENARREYHSMGWAMNQVTELNGAEYMENLEHIISRMLTAEAEVSRLTRLLPPGGSRAEGGVGEGGWAVFAEKVVGEREAAEERLLSLRGAVRELLEVARLRGDSSLPSPVDDEKLWTSRMQAAWDDLAAEMEG